MSDDVRKLSDEALLRNHGLLGRWNGTDAEILRRMEHRRELIAAADVAYLRARATKEETG